MSVRQVLLVEDDPQMADLLKLLIEAAAPGTRVDWVSEVDSAERSFSTRIFDLVLCDWNLPGRAGIALAGFMRKRGSKTPIIMITGRSDRASVLAARSQGVDAFIAKPFQAEAVVARLRGLLADDENDDSSSNESAAPAKLGEFLSRLNDSELELPVMQGVRHGSDLLAEEDGPDLADLKREWERDPVLSSRLIAMASSSAFNSQGRPCSSLGEALQRLGWRTAVNVATALALKESVKLDDALLRARAERQVELAERVAEQAIELARSCGIDSAPCHTAALLHRVGHSCVIYQAQEYLNRGGSAIDVAELEQALNRFGDAFLDRLQAIWRVPARLRETMGCIQSLPAINSRPEKYVMRIAGARVYGDLSEDEINKLKRVIER